MNFDINASHNRIKSPVQVLLVSFSPQLEEQLRAALPAATYILHNAAVGDNIPAIIRSAKMDILLVDRDRYGSGTMSMIDEVTTVAPQVAIIILAERPMLVEVITAVKLHVADVIQKPARVDELVAAIKMHQAHHTVATDTPVTGFVNGNDGRGVGHAPDKDGVIPDTVSVRGLTLNRRTGIAALGEAWVKLSPKENAILAALMHRAGYVISCRKLVATGWQKDLPDAEARNTIRPYVSRLRKKLQKDLQLGNVIVTVDRQGYVFSADDVSKVV